MITAIISSAIGALLLVAAIIAVLYRVVVPTNMVHIVQSTKQSVPYGRGKEAGNTYYAWPSWIPRIGVVVTQFPESIFQVTLKDYEAYDSNRLPFVVDVTAFFRVEHAETAAQRVETFHELQNQLTSVLQGAVRRVLATNELEAIMQERSTLGQQFTNEVKNQISEWGVIPVKTIEFMDLRDSTKSAVIANIMEKEKSRIEKESRIKVAENQQEAQTKEIEAQRIVDVNKQEALQQVGQRTAEKEKQVGIANQQSQQEVLAQARVTAERQQEVQRVNDVKAAEIQKEVAVVKAKQDQEVVVVEAEAAKSVEVVNAEAYQKSTEIKASGDLFQAQKKAEGIKAEGLAKAEAEKAMLMAPVDTQITLAKEIGENQGYQTYLINIEQIKVSGNVGVELAKAIQNADLKVIANSGDIQSGVNSLGDLFTAKGGTNLTGMLAALSQTDEGKALVAKISGGSKE